MTIADPEDEERVRVSRDGTIQLRRAGTRSWETTALRRLAREYASDHPIWTQLRRRGLRRPSPSGPTVPEDRRQRARCTLRLPAVEIDRLDALAERWGTSRSDAVLRLLATAVPTDNPSESLTKKS